MQYILGLKGKGKGEGKGYWSLHLGWGRGQSFVLYTTNLWNKRTSHWTYFIATVYGINSQTIFFFFLLSSSSSSSFFLHFLHHTNQAWRCYSIFSPPSSDKTVHESGGLKSWIIPPSSLPSLPSLPLEKSKLGKRREGKLIPSIWRKHPYYGPTFKCFQTHY